MKCKSSYNNESGVSSPSVSDREMTKWAKIIGPKTLIDLYVEDKVKLTPEQLDKLVEMKRSLEP